MADNVNHPAHYETGKFECIDVMVETQGVEATQNFCVCNALKYVYRHKKKNGMEDMYQTVLTICGMPNRNGGTSTSDTGSAVIMRDGWSAAEARAKDSELMFKKSERIFLKLILNICKTLKGMNLKVCNIEIRFTRRNYENILQKAQVLDLMLKNSKIHPRLAFEHCGLFVDSDLAYTLSAEYAEEQEKKAQELLEKQNTEKEDETDDSNTDKGNGAAGGNAAQARQQSGSAD